MTTCGLLWLERQLSVFFFSSRRRHTRCSRDWSSDVCSSDLGDRGAAFFVTNPLMQDQPDKSTLSMGNGSDRLVVSQAWDRAAIHNFEDASLGPGSSVGRLVEKAPHVTVALRGPMAVVHACTLLIARASAHPRGETFRGGKGFCRGTDFSNDLLC